MFMEEDHTVYKYLSLTWAWETLVFRSKFVCTSVHSDENAALFLLAPVLALVLPALLEQLL